MEETPREKTAGNETVERERLVEKIYQAALAEHEKFKELPETEFRAVIESALTEIEELEKFADPKAALAALTPETAKNLSALWVFSGAGTYDSAAKDDRYKNYPWAKWMDHNRLSYAGWLTRISAEQIALGGHPRGAMSEAAERKTNAKKAITEHGPTVIYNGTAQENEVVRNVPTREGVIVPKEKVLVVGEGIEYG